MTPTFTEVDYMRRNEHRGAAIIAGLLVALSTAILVSPWTIPGVLGLSLYLAFHYYP